MSDPNDLIFKQHLGLAYKYGILQGQTKKAEDYLKEVFDNYEDMRALGDAYLQSTSDPGLLERDFVSRVMNQFVKTALT